MISRISAETKFTYHNAGQGLFYSGEIKLSKFNKNVRFVYDCGSENTRLINTSVRRFKQDIKSDEIDLLIISHLHSDHVSGLNELFNNFTIKEVILPYFAPIERLFIALRRINMPLWYYDFLSDPVTYLFERGVKRVIVLVGEEGGEGGPPPEELPPNPSEGENQIKLDIEKLPDDEDLEKIISQQDINWQKYIEKGRLLIKNHNGYISALGLWIFRFFNYKILPSVLQYFEGCFRDNGLEVDNENIKRAIRDVKRLKELKRCYTILGRQLKNDFNNTSLVLYHGPVGRPKSKSSFLWFCSCCFYSPCVWLHRIFHKIFFEDINNSFGQFLTGDINLNMKYGELIKHYTRYTNNILITQIPHHGARKNWNRNIIDDLPNSDFWVISAGFRNRYGHPSYKVIEDIYLNEKNVFWINEINYITIRGEIIW